MSKYIMIDEAMIPIQRPVITYRHDKEKKEVILDEQTYIDLNRCAYLVHNALKHGPIANLPLFRFDGHLT